MARRVLDHEWGRAVDNENTVTHHQIFRIEEDKKYDICTLHYSVFHAVIDKPPTYNIPDKFIETMYGKTPEDHAERLAMEKLYMSLLKGIRVTGKDAGFMLNKPIHALTYDISFDPDYNITDFDVRPTMATMTEKMTCEDASSRMGKRRQGREFRKWHDLVKSVDHVKSKKDMGFGEVTSRTTALIQSRMCKKAFNENIDCVYRIDPENAYVSLQDFQNKKSMSIPERMALYGQRYGSVLAHKDKDVAAMGVIPTTASRNGLDSFNIAVITEFVKTGKNIFTQGVAGAVAEYKRHVMTWQYMDAQKKLKAA